MMVEAHSKVKSGVQSGTDITSSGLYSQEQLGWLKLARQFADNISIEETMASDKKNEFRRDLFEKACQVGFGALPFIKDFGGKGGDYTSFCLVNEEFARRCVPVMSSVGVHILCQEPIYRFGTQEQKEKYLTHCSSGKHLAAFGLTEPNAGSDTAALQTQAHFDSATNEYVINGTKTFITSGASADIFIVMAKISGEPHVPFPDLKDGKKDQTITAFIVERGFPGFEIGQKFDMLGMRGYSTCELVFTDCRVPAHNVLGQPGQGRKVALSSLAKGRVTIAAQATGWAQGALDALLKGLKDQSKDMTPEQLVNSTEFAQVAAQIGELAIQVEAARVLTYQAAATVDRGAADVTLAAMAKITATDAAMKVSTEAMSILGMAGLKPELLLERIFRDAKAGQIYEGTNQIQRMLIGRDLIK
ncbi:MAG: acyl-CoA dehydrogenase family protein [Cyanobacteria bacterium TGS_CYA1]|nr:acyl-CoA dehydrogenase family protein [Cyanobacteria bacterium TGS_CYA1]